MGRYIIRRLIWLVGVLFVVSLVTFTLMHTVPGGPFDREKTLPKEIIANLNARYHLDEPLPVQYLLYVYEALVPQLSDTPPGISVLDDGMVNIKVGEALWLKWMNFGPSYASRTRTVNDIFRDNLPLSFQLGVMALGVAVLIGLPLGTLAALRQNSAMDYGAMGFAILGVSVPVIVLGPILIAIFGVVLKWLPPTGWGAGPPWTLGLFPSEMSLDYFRYACMPVVALGIGSTAVIARVSRASLLQVIREDYIRTARAKGLVERLVVTRHALKNSLIPVVTVLGPLFAALVTGTFVTELIFGLPGMGKYFVTSIGNRDYPVIMGTILLYAFVLVFANLVVDLIYAWLDPRIRYT
jgi:ABC-type dipeptide/oligopeptide/nickel transport system permease component